MFDYFDTKIPWINEIPQSWEIVPLFDVAEENKRKNKDKNENVLSLSYGKIIRKDISKNFGLLPNNFDNYQVVDKGYIIIRSTDLQNDKKSLRVGLVKEEGVITSAYIGLSPKSRIDPEYLFYYLNMCDLKKVFYSLGGGLRQSLRYEEFKRFPVIKNDLREQKLISQYLEKKTSEIQSLIKKIEKKIQLLKEEKTALINQYVTKGLDPNAEMKDSGVEWIGKIPKHWEVQKITTLYSQSSIRGHQNEQNLSVFRDYGVVRRDDYENKNVLPEDLSNYKLVRKGDLVLNKMKTWMGSLGVSDFQGIVSPAYYVLTPNFNFFAGYLHHLLRSKLYIDQYASLSKGVRPGQWDLGISEFKSLKIILPPIDEQKKINEFITKKLSYISQLSEFEVARIEKLTEYRQSLISSVVTGKIRITEDMI
tara:strand:- start:371 stop:1633 length:1263 start_codon:yes stop_codon:yes gene_type:complete